MSRFCWENLKVPNKNPQKFHLGTLKVPEEVFVEAVLILPPFYGSLKDWKKMCQKDRNFRVTP